jgi:hypothetical protein
MPGQAVIACRHINGVIEGDVRPYAGAGGVFGHVIFDEQIVNTCADQIHSP